jgi:hypothetical protein
LAAATYMAGRVRVIVNNMVLAEYTFDSLENWWLFTSIINSRAISQIKNS